MSAHLCRSRRMRSDEAKSRYRIAKRTVRSEAEAKGTKREVVVGSARGLWPNISHQRDRGPRTDENKREWPRLGRGG